MGINTGMRDQTDSKKSNRRKPVEIVFFVLAILILLLEFSYDLRKEFLLRQLVLGLDIALLSLFFFLVAKEAFKHRSALMEFIARERMDVAYVTLVASFLFLPRIAAGLVIVRLSFSLLMRILETKLGHHLLSNLSLRPSQSLALSFIGLIGVGTILLTFPAATTDGRGATFINAMFTMTSASCVAGLCVYNIGADFTNFGQAVILFGIQAGGLGIMVLSAAFAVLVGGSIPSRRQIGLREVLDVSTPEGLKSLIKSVTATTVFTEFLGALALFLLSSEQIPKVTDRLWWSIFHAVSAFCNAGVPLSPNSMMAFIDESWVCIVLMVLISIGGIGFYVISDLTDPEVWKIKRPRAVWERLQIQTKVVLIATVILNTLGMLLFLFFEYDGALHGLTGDRKIMASLFHAVSLRSAGFNVVPLEGIIAPTVFFSVILMFIGAGPGSTGGGIKITTSAVSIVALRAMLRGREEVELFGRRIPPSTVSRSLSTMLVAAMALSFFLTLLLATQKIEFEHMLFESISAFGTVGLSMGATTSLNSVGKILIICLMFVGRIGPLTIALAVGERKSAKRFRLPKGRIPIG